MNELARLRHFVVEFTRLIERSSGQESRVLDEGGELLSALVKHDDWLPAQCARTHPQHYQQHLLHCDPLERFSVVSFVWGPAQSTPIHNHTVWGLIGVMRGAETCRRFAQPGAGQPLVGLEPYRLSCGQTDKVSPAIGDVHEVANAFNDSVSISIHVYGANIGAVKRQVFDLATGNAKPFVSGYSNDTTPNFWDRSADVRATMTT